MQPHQQRVVDEQSELEAKIDLLLQFMTTNPIFSNLPNEEKFLLGLQANTMGCYNDILKKRIEAFNSTNQEGEQ